MATNFTINVKGLREASEPAVAVATTATVDKHPTAYLIAMTATPESLILTANGGRMSVKLPVLYEQNGYCTQYKFGEGGTIVIRANDLQTVLNSFGDTDVLIAEVIDAPVPPLPEDAKDEEREAWKRMAGRSLRLSLQSDPEQMQTLPLMNIPLNFFTIEGKPQRVVTLPRLTVCHAISKTLFAAGFEEEREKFMYWKLLVRSGTEARFIAGSGARFASEDLQMTSAIASAPSGDKVLLLVPNKQSTAMLKVLNNSTDPSVTFAMYESKMLVTSGDVSVAIVALNPNLKWPDEDDILRRRNLYKFSVAISELQPAIKGLLATDSAEIKKREEVHVATLSFDANKRVLSLFSDRSTKKALRKVKLHDVYVGTDQPSDVSFRCNVKYLDEISKVSDKNTHVQLELVSKDHPMIVRFSGEPKVADKPIYQVNSAIGGSESFSMLIARIGDGK